MASDVSMRGSRMSFLSWHVFVEVNKRLFVFANSDFDLALLQTG